MASGLRPGAIDRGRLPVQTRDRRAALSALALLLVVAGALGSALVVYRSGHRTDVVVAAHDIKPGQLITKDDFSVARVANDGGAVIAWSDRATFFGDHAVYGIPQGSLVAPHMFDAGSALPPDGVVVGVTLSVTRRPAVDLAVGDLVRVYFVEDASQGTGATTGVTVPTAAPTTTAGAAAGDAFPNAKVLVDTAKVIEAPKSQGTSSDLTLSLLLKPADAQKVVAANAANQVALGRLPVTGTPAIDLQASPTTATGPTPTATPTK